MQIVPLESERGRSAGSFLPGTLSGKVSLSWICSDHVMQGPNVTATPLDSVQACLEQFGKTVTIAYRLVRAGKRVDLTGLDADMGYVCARMLDLPPDEGRALQPALIALRRDLDALSGALAARVPPPG